MSELIADMILGALDAAAYFLKVLSLCLAWAVSIAFSLWFAGFLLENLK